MGSICIDSDVGDSDDGNQRWNGAEDGSDGNHRCKEVGGGGDGGRLVAARSRPFFLFLFSFLFFDELVRA